MKGYGGFGGGGFGGGNMQSLMKQAQKMQQEMQKAQEELEELEIEGASGNGLVTVVLSGKKVLKSVHLDPKVVDPDDAELLEDLIMAAYNEALAKAEEEYNSRMGAFGGMGL